MEEEPILVRFDRGRHCEEGADQGGGWGVRQGRVLQGGRAEGRVEARGATGQGRSAGVGQEGRRRGAVTVEGTVHGLDGMFAWTTSAGEVLVLPLERGASRDVTTQYGLSPAAMPPALSTTRPSCD